MAPMMDLSNAGHLSVLFQLILFRRRKQNGVTVFDTTEPEIDLTQFLTKDVSETPYVPCNEDSPSNYSAPRGM